MTMPLRRISLALTALLLTAQAAPPPPSQLFAGLFEQVQARRLFRDSKTFADAVPRRAPEAILAAWRRGAFRDDEELRRFVAANFDVPPEDTPLPQASSTRRPIIAHITSLWPALTRTTRSAPAGSSLLTVPEPYVVPGGRFRELYYWDSYFTMLGLARTGRQDLVESMVVNFGSLIDRYGHVPNGTRTYYLSRSQPPFFYLMTRLSHDVAPGALARRNNWLRAEHRFWMAGADRLRPGESSRRVVRFADGSFLNRYWDDRPLPRDESWREDVALAEANPQRPAPQLYRDIRAAAESGWDFSSRWLGDGRTLATIRTTRIVPVDLNSLMFGLEETIAANCRLLRDLGCAREFTGRAGARKAAIERFLWHPHGFYTDYDLDRRAPVDRRTAAMAYPLFTGVASPDRARAAGEALRRLIAPGGLVTTGVATGEQWDAPNGWAPLQWIAVAGLRRYGLDYDGRIARRWMATVEREYAASGRLLEKYDVKEAREGGGGEYPLQDGFGWTNGVYAELRLGTSD